MLFVDNRVIVDIIRRVVRPHPPLQASRHVQFIVYIEYVFWGIGGIGIRKVIDFSIYVVQSVGTNFHLF